MMKMIRTIFVLAAAAGLIFSYSSCERHSYEDTSKLQHHGDHGDVGHDDGSHGAGHGSDADPKKDDHGDDHAKEEKAAEKGRKVF